MVPAGEGQAGGALRGRCLQGLSSWPRRHLLWTPKAFGNARLRSGGLCSSSPVSTPRLPIICMQLSQPSGGNSSAARLVFLLFLVPVSLC